MKYFILRIINLPEGHNYVAEAHGVFIAHMKPNAIRFTDDSYTSDVKDALLSRGWKLEKIYVTDEWAEKKNIYIWEKGSPIDIDGLEKQRKEE